MRNHRQAIATLTLILFAGLPGCGKAAPAEADRDNLSAAPLGNFPAQDVKTTTNTIFFWKAQVTPAQFSTMSGYVGQAVTDRVGASLLGAHEDDFNKLVTAETTLNTNQTTLTGQQTQLQAGIKQATAASTGLAQQIQATTDPGTLQTLTAKKTQVDAQLTTLQGQLTQVQGGLAKVTAGFTQLTTQATPAGGMTGVHAKLQQLQGARADFCDLTANKIPQVGESYAAPTEFSIHFTADGKPQITLSNWAVEGDDNASYCPTHLGGHQPMTYQSGDGSITHETYTPLGGIVTFDLKARDGNLYRFNLPRNGYTQLGPDKTTWIPTPTKNISFKGDVTEISPGAPKRYGNVIFVEILDPIS